MIMFGTTTIDKDDDGDRGDQWSVSGRCFGDRCSVIGDLFPGPHGAGMTAAQPHA